MSDIQSKTTTSVWTGLDETIENSRLYFAQSNLENLQNLVRFIDQKAAFILTAVGVMTAALFTLIAGTVFAPAKTPLDVGLEMLFGTATLIYTILAALVVFAAARIYSAGGAILKPETSAPGMIFPMTLLRRYNADEDLYHSKLASLSYDEMLHDYANQMMEVSNIYQQKHYFVNASIGRFRWLCMAWIVAVLLGTIFLLHAV